MKLSVITLLAAGLLATASVVPYDQATDVAEFDVTEVTVYKQVCLKPCFKKRPKCPKGFRPRRRGHCWKCCKRRRHHVSEEAEVEEEDEELYEFEDMLD
jgi:hypothetical protein